MSTTLSRSDPVPIPNVKDSMSFSYKEIVRNITANAPQPYGAIPPLMKKRKQKKKRQQTNSRPRQAVRRMSHVENWVAVDSKESLPDEEELIHSPFQNFLSVDFLTGILPLHMPPPSLSDPMTLLQQQEIARFTHHLHNQTKTAASDDVFDTTANLAKSPSSPSSTSLFDQDEEDEEDDTEARYGNRSVSLDEDEDEEEDDDDEEDEEEEDDEEEEEEEEDDDESDFSPTASSLVNTKQTVRNTSKLTSTLLAATTRLPSPSPSSASSVSLSTDTLTTENVMVGRLSIPSFTKSHTPSTSTTTSYAMSSSPPDQDRQKWIHTIAKLRQSLALSQPSSPATRTHTTDTSVLNGSSSTDNINGIPIMNKSSKSLPSSLSSSPSSDITHGNGKYTQNGNKSNSNNNNDTNSIVSLNEKTSQQHPSVIIKKSSSTTTTATTIKNGKNTSGFIPMPLPPRKKRSTRKRRSEATTQPRFNFDTNTYTRDTRSNPDHLRMIAAELNMMRSRKLFSPLKPRGFLPRRKDPFICGDGRVRSPLRFEIV